MLQLIIIVLSFLGSFSQAERGLGNEDQAILQMLQQKAEMAEREKQWSQPLKPSMDAKRAVLGSRKAPIFIAIYSDFECPYCSMGAKNIEAVRKKYGAKVAIQFKHLPLPFHQMALPSAQYFEAIALQNPKWAYQFHDAVFAQQGRLKAEGVKFLDEVAKKTGANMKAVHANLSMPEVKNRIETDKEEARKFGIQGTPGFIVAGIALKGAYPLEEFSAIIDKRLAEKQTRSLTSSPKK